MNQFVKTALALVAAGSVANAEPSDNEWLELDREINSLASAVPSTGSIAGWAVLLRSAYAYSSDDRASASDPDDVSGVNLMDARFAAWGEVADYGWRVSFNFADSFSSSFEARLEDAYVYWLCGEYFTATMGSFRPHVFRSNSIYEENQLFIDRTILGASFDFYDLGIGARGDYEDFTWFVEVMNGLNSELGGHLFLGRVEYHYNGGAGDYEGSHGHKDDPAGTAGIVYLQDDGIDGIPDADTALYGFDLNGTVGPVGIGFEYASVDDDLAATLGAAPWTAGSFFGIPLVPSGGSAQPWSATASYELSPDMEVAFRYQDSDNVIDDTVWTAAVIWRQNGNMSRWNAEVSHLDADSSAGDVLLFQVGYSVGSSL